MGAVDKKESNKDNKKLKKIVKSKKSDGAAIKPKFEKGKITKPKFDKFKKDGVKPKGDGKEAEKTNWMEMKKKKKALRVERKKTKISEEGYEVSHKAKLLSAQLQKKSTKKETINTLCQELHNLLKDKYYTSFALSHDMSRVIQVLIKHSDEKIKQQILEKLEPIIFQMTQSKYAQHSVKTMLKSGTNLMREKIIQKFLSHIVSLASHTVSAPILDYAFGEFATQNDKIMMVQEFYGEMYKNSKDLNIKKMSDAYKDSPEMKDAILNSVKSNIQKVIDKNLHDGELFHWVLCDYLNECKEDNRTELIAALSPLIVPLINSQHGVDAACICLWYGTNKDKKTILKVVKEHVIPVATHKVGYKLLLAIFSSLDDTVMVKKTILSALANSIKDLANSHSGRKVLHFLVKPYDTSIFHPTLIQALKEGNEKSTSKKDQSIREKELKEAFIPAISKEILNDVDFWFKDPSLSLLTVAILQNIVDENREKVFNAVAKYICNPDSKIGKTNTPLFEDAGMGTVIKKLAQADSALEIYTFGEAILNSISKDTLNLWICSNRGCFILVHLIENNVKLISKYKDLLKPYISKLESQNGQGASVLLSKIK